MVYVMNKKYFSLCLWKDNETFQFAIDRI